MGDLYELKRDIKDSIGWLRRAEAIASMAGIEGYKEGDWPVMDRLAARIDPLLRQLSALLPLEPELEEAIKAEWEEESDYESPEAMGCHPLA